MPGTSPVSRLNPDFRDMLSALSAEGVEFLIGAYVVGAHARPRATGDLDIWVRPTRENARRVLRALKRFGAPLFDLTEEDLVCEETVFQIGIPPQRIDILTGITGVDFESAWNRRMGVSVDGVRLEFIGRADLIANKRATGRPKDLADLAYLEEQDRLSASPEDL